MIPKPESCIGCPLYSKPYGKPTGFSIPDGTGLSGVMVVAEALGEAEEQEGRALVGKSGFALFQQLQRVDILRDDLTLYNCVACRPPDNKLVKMPYEQAAINHCSPNLDRAILAARQTALSAGKTFVIVTLGVTAFKRVMGYDYKRNANLMKADYIGYPFWNQQYQAWVFAADHPAFLMRGNTHLWPVVQFVFKRAQEVADNGLILDEPYYELDPDSTVFDQWIEGYIESLESDPENPLSYDIETPYKKKKTEEDLGKEEDADHTILRCSFSYWSHTLNRTFTSSVKWSAEYMAGIERLFATAPFVLGWNSDNYDYPRVSRYVKINGVNLDGMVAWHILNSSLPKGLGFVTPYYVQNTLMWKHLSEDQPAFYNAKDADMALRNYLGIRKDLATNGLWRVFDRHVLQINKALKYMSGIGVLRDNVMRQESEEKMSGILANIEQRMEGAVPQDARKVHIYKKKPKDAEGLIELVKEYPVKYCGKCGLQKPNKKSHPKVCDGETIELSEPQTVWGKPLKFKVSKLGMMNYQKSLAHQAIRNRKEQKITFNEDAIVRLMRNYPNDKLYPLIIDHRKVQKLLSTYVGVTQENGKIRGGMPVGKDGRIHTTYTHNPSTLRFASEDPNLQNLPRPSKDPNDLVNIIRNLVVAQEGSILYARDFSGIEAVLTGYFALDPKYIRIAKQDVHTYYTVYALYELEGGARIRSADLPDLDWPDDRLFPYLAELKKQFGKERNGLYKHLVHAANFMQSPKGAQEKIFSETRIEYPVKTVAKVMGVYYSLFPSIPIWHKNVLAEAEKDGYLRNPFEYVHRFSRVYEYKKEFGEWTKKPGTDANRVISFKPQSTAAAIIKEAILRLYYDRFEEAGKYLRLQVHDELLFEVPEQYEPTLDSIVKEEMERPVPELRLPTSWGMGSCLAINTEEKKGYRWGSMK
jgi:uracil-DNA glycosylase family 4